MVKKQEGITLVALVITIIVMLILAGVSISLVVGNNGVLTQASSAVLTNNVATVYSDVSTALAAAETAYYAGWSSNTSHVRTEYYDKALFDELCTNCGYTSVSVSTDGSTYTVCSSTTAKSGVKYIKVVNGSETYTFTLSGDITTAPSSSITTCEYVNGTTTTTISY